MPKIEDFNSLIVEVDSKKNIMFLKGEENKKLTNIKSYKVSTARTNIKKPLGIGDITAISLEATEMGRPLYEKYGFVKMVDEMELIK